MLKNLRVKNYALIHDLNLSFDKGLLVVTGETGSGKSIILGALGLVLGDRADSTAIAGHESKCIVEADFDIRSYHLQSFFAANELDYEELCVLRREISIQGKSRAFINDTPVSLNQLKELGEALIDIHSQHETVSLKDRRYQVQLLDSFAGNNSLLDEYRKAWNTERSLGQELKHMLEQEAKLREEYDYNLFLLRELSTANLKAGEVAALDEEQKQLENASEISKAAFEAVEGMRDNENSAQNILGHVEGLIKQQLAHAPAFISLYERLKSVVIELDDISGELSRIAELTNRDDVRLEQITERLDLIYSLQKKHRVESVEALIHRTQELEEKTAKVESIEEEKENLRKRHLEAITCLNEAVEKVRSSRSKALPTLIIKLSNLLAEVGLPHAQIDFKVEPLEQFGEEGPDQVTMLFSSNPGSAMQPLNKVASGGELSRVMLCLKSVLAASRSLPTLVFDEIDTGISGEVAAKVGRVMREMSKEHQIISITHLPQIAGFGTHHYSVYKELSNGRTHTYMRQLGKEERLREVARMLSGDQISDSALANAGELIDAYRHT